MIKCLWFMEIYDNCPWSMIILWWRIDDSAIGSTDNFSVEIWENSF